MKDQIQYMPTSRTKPFTTKRFFSDLASFFLSDSIANRFSIDEEDLISSRKFFLEGYSFADLAREKGYFRSKIIRVRKSVQKPFCIIMESIKSIIKENKLLIEENLRLKVENDYLHMKASGKKYIHFNSFVPAASLSLNPKLESFLLNHNVFYISERQGLVLYDLNNIRGLGKLGIEEIKEQYYQVKEKDYK